MTKKEIKGIHYRGNVFNLINPRYKGEHEEYVCKSYSKNEDEICYFWEINNWFPGSFSHEEYSPV